MISIYYLILFGEDFKEVILDLNDTGYEFDPNWYKVVLDFRFPIFGTVQSGDIKLEIRMAIEPWLVLGAGRNSRWNSALCGFVSRKSASASIRDDRQTTYNHMQR
jgi:uncharacterized protein (DUF2126 family)